jgi:hypothetical protein
LRDHLHYLIDRLQSLGEHSFWPVWLTLTAVALVSTALLLRPKPGPTASRDAPLPVSFGRSRGTAASITLLALFLAGYIAVMLVGEDFTSWDNSVFTLYSLRGIDFPPPIYRDSGRFNALGYQQFNLLGRVNRSVVGYHAFPICEMLMVVSIFLVLEDRLSIASRAALAAFVLVLPSVVVAVVSLVYMDCDVMFWLACVALSVELFARTRSVWWALAAVLSAQFALYYKETVFLFLLTFAGARILLRARRSGSVREAFRDAEARLDLAIAGVSLAFAAFYAIVILSNSHLSYLVDTRISLLQTLSAYLRMDWLVWIFAVFTIIRMYRVLRGAAAPVLLWDGLACGALVWFAAFLAMGMVKEYYLALADLIAALYLGRFLCLSWGGMRIPVRAVAAGLAILVIVQSLDLSTLRIVGRKYVVQREVSAANVIVGMRARESGRATRLYFPFTSPFAVVEFAAYLSYRGVPVEGAGRASSDDVGVELYSAKILQTGRCYPTRDFICHPGPAGDEDLVVVFPDDAVSPSEAKLHHELEEKLVARDPPSRARALFFLSLEFLWKCANLI